MQLTLEIPEVVNISQIAVQILFAMNIFEADKLFLGEAVKVSELSYRAF